MTGIPAAVTLADGESRPVDRTWPDGSWECPWCWSPVRAEEPACDTMLGAAGLAARRADQQRREEEEQRERGWQEYRVRAAAERAAARDAAWAEVSASAQAAGQCLRCLRRSDFERAPRSSATVTRELPRGGETGCLPGGPGFHELVDVVTRTAQAFLHLYPGPRSVVLAVGCHDGRQRSVAVAREASALLGYEGTPVRGYDRDVNRPAVAGGGHGD
jgi:hypothetical protein